MPVYGLCLPGRKKNGELFETVLFVFINHYAIFRPRRCPFKALWTGHFNTILADWTKHLSHDLFILGSYLLLGGY